MSASNIIYVGNIQSITDEQLREYFERFGKIQAFYHNCTRASDEWLIDYRFIKFSSDTDMNVFLTNKVDHVICRIRLDIHPYQEAFKEETRLVLDRKICIAHTDSKLDRNVIKKTFSKYGRILNCTCVSSGTGVEYVYIEFESVNSVGAVLTPGRRHFAGRSTLAVKKPLRPAEVGTKKEFMPINEPTISKYSQRQRFNSNVDTAQYSSILINHQNHFIEQEIRTVTPSPDQSLNLLVESPHRLGISYNNNISLNTNIESYSQQQLKDYEQEYDLIIRQDFDEMTYQIDKFLQNQKQSYKKVRQFISDAVHSQSSSSSSSSSSSEDGEIGSTSSDSENLTSNKKKRLKSQP